MNIIDIAKKLSGKEFSFTDRAIAIVYFSGVDCMSVRDINEILVSAGYSKQNNSRLELNLRNDKRITVCNGNGFRINLRYQKEIEEKFSPIIGEFEEVEVELTEDQSKVYEELVKISETLAIAYNQVVNDLSDSKRISFAGTAHELRQVLSSLLIILAPDSEVEQMRWFVQNSDTKGPTQKQKVRYILETNRMGTKESEVIEKIDTLDEMLKEFTEDIVRSTYGRASDAAHRFKSRSEASNIHRYFIAFAFDILGIE